MDSCKILKSDVYLRHDAMKELLDNFSFLYIRYFIIICYIYISLYAIYPIIEHGLRVWNYVVHFLILHVKITSLLLEFSMYIYEHYLYVTLVSSH